MLTFLSIANLAVFEKVEVELGAGLTVVSGETGSGKSVLLSAIALLAGAGLPKDRLRHTADELAVQGIWTLTGMDCDALSILMNLEPEDELPDELIVRRTARVTEITKRERMFLGDRVAQLKDLDAFGQLALNISGQHDFVGLMQRQTHLGMLDAFALADGLRGEMRQTHADYLHCKQRLDALHERNRTAMQRREELDEVLATLGGLAVARGEEEELRTTIHRITHLAELNQALDYALASLYEKDQAIVPELVRVQHSLESAVPIQAALEPLVAQVTSAVTELQDVVRTLRSMNQDSDGSLSLDMDRMQERLHTLERHKRRHGVTRADELLDLQDRYRTEREDLESVDQQLEKARQDLTQASRHVRDVAQRLGELRRKVIPSLETSMNDVLGTLEMPKARFAVQISHLEEPTDAGMDRVDFLLAPNPGTPPMPLSAVASGGELSRVLLALKTVVSGSFGVPTYVFDEVDAGIGGVTALAVAALLARLSMHHQVLCITHTPQLAAYADHHLVVSKTADASTTRAVVRELIREEDRVEELARMMSGMKDSDSARTHAFELLAQARRDKGTTSSTRV